MTNKEGLLIIHSCPDTLEEDIIPQQVDMNSMSEIVFEDDEYTVYRPLSDEGMIYLSQDTKWLSSNTWNGNKYVRGDFNEISDTNWNLSNWKNNYVIIPKNYKKGDKKYLFTSGYGDCYVPSGARYSMATVAYDLADKELWRWFINKNFAYISTNLKKKVGGQLLDKNKTELVYPDEFVGDYDPKALTYAARANSGIKKITIKPGTTEIKAGAFAAFPIESIEIPEGVKKIGNRAFQNCSHLTSVTLPESLTSLGVEAFSGCPIKSIKLPSGLKKLPDGIFSAGYGRTANGWGNIGCELIEIELPSTITSIGHNAFSDQVNLKKVTIPEGVLEIGAHAFEGCKKLKEIHIPKSVKTLGGNCFEGTGIKKLFIPSTVDFVDHYILYHPLPLWNSGLNTNHGIKVYCEAPSKPSNWSDKWDVVDSKYHFNGPDEYARAEVIWGAHSITEDLQPIEISFNKIKPVYKDERWEVYNPQCMDDLAMLSTDTGWVFAEGTRHEYQWTYSNLSDDAMARRFYIFMDHQKGERYIYSTQQFTINDHSTFYLFDSECNEWEPDENSGITTKWHYRIGAEILIRFLLQEGTLGLMEWAAKKWKGGLSDLMTFVQAKKLYQECEGIITYNSDLYKSIKESSWWFNPAMDVLKKKGGICGVYATGHIDATIPRNTRRIEDEAFYDWGALTEITLPNSITFIGDSAFSCTNLQEINLPDNLEHIGSYAFSSCNFKYVFIPKSVRYIGLASFRPGWNSPRLVICCEAESKPNDWNDRWLDDSLRPGCVEVYWGCKRGEIPQEEPEHQE